MKLRLATKKKSVPWTMKDIDRAICDLKNNKSRDFEGYVNEIFKTDVIGSDLKKSILKMQKLGKGGQRTAEICSN